MKKLILISLALLLSDGKVRAQGKVRAAREVAEVLIERFGAKAGRSVPQLTARIESVAAKHGSEALIAIERGGPAACGLIEAAGTDGAKVIRVLMTHGEEGAARVLSRPQAMRQYLQFGDEAASVLVRHPGVAEPLVERGGAQAVKALGAVTPQNGRRIAMLVDGELAGSAARHPEVMALVAKHGNLAADFIWKNKATLAGGAALAAFLSDPEPFLNGTRDIASVAGEAVVKPVVTGITTVLMYALIGVGLLIAAVTLVVRKHGLPSPEAMKTAFSLFKK